VPHDTRSNTATFLEGVISYIQSLQQSNAAMEAELAAVRTMRAAAQTSFDQQQELLVQPAGSGSNPANSCHQPSQQQHSQQYFGSSWRQDSINGASPHSPEAAAAAAAAAAMAASAAPNWPRDSSLSAAATASLQPNSRVPRGGHLMQHPQEQLQQPASLPARGSTERQALSSSPRLHSAPAAAAAAAGPASTTWSAPAALMHSLMQPGLEASTATGGPAPGAAGVGAQVAPASVPALQPVELQSVLEKALLAALQQQAQHLASQLLSRGT